MIKFFRRIRQKLLSENRFNKYLLYAIGEIVLVVLGILIALQINNWNEKRNNLDLANNYISNLIEELNIQIATLDDIYISRFDRKLKGLESAKSYFTKIKSLSVKVIDDNIHFYPTCNRGWQQGFINEKNLKISVSNYKYISEDALGQITLKALAECEIY